MLKHRQLKSRNKVLSLEKPLIMGILNVTPDSFSDGGKFVRGGIDVDAAISRALQMVDEGADIIDIGGESTGPGSKDVSLEEELKRVIPVVKKFKIQNAEGTGLKSEIRMSNVEMSYVEKGAKVGVERSVLISVDTYKSEVARQAIEAGADLINDVTALRGDKNMAAVLAQYPDVPIVIMYSKDSTARTARENVRYDNVIATVRKFLEERVAAGASFGIARERFILDPGMGAFVSDDSKYSLEILDRLAEFKNFGLPILIGASRKGFIGKVLAQARGLDAQESLPVAERLEGSLACAAIATYNGASILRVHDVKETRRVVDMVYSIINY